MHPQAGSEIQREQSKMQEMICFMTAERKLKCTKTTNSRSTSLYTNT